MLKDFLKRFKKVEPKVEVKHEPRRPIFTTDTINYSDKSEEIRIAFDRNLEHSVHPLSKTSFSMDNQVNVKAPFYGNNVIPQGQMLWFANQTFIGWQLCAMIAQHWLVDKCCAMPADDAIRAGFDITVNDGKEVDTEILDEIKKLDIKYRLNANMKEFIKLGRVFGIRIAMFKVESDDPEYYFKPFNPDGIAPNSYRGISQIDPYWISPQLDPASAGDPSSVHFYEPTWWNVAGKLIHRTHLVIFKTDEVADILKPAYIYGGIPIPQKIAERVFAAERTANEAPMLALTKRTDVINIDTSQFVANQPVLASTLEKWAYYRDNYGVKVLGLDEKMEQFDTSLAELDAVIMTQYQLVAAAANVPAVKLLGTTPKGFNSTGEYEEASYHEMLESLQANNLTEFVNRHHLILMRSEISPKYGIEPFEVEIMWKPLDAMTSKELAELNKLKAETAQILTNSGAIDGYDERQRLILDPESGYTGMNEDDIIETTEAENETNENESKVGRE